MAGSDKKEPKARKAKQAEVSEDANDAPLHGRLAKLLQHADEMFSRSSDYKMSVAEFIRLLQMQNELEEDRPVEVWVQWVDLPADALNG